MLQGVRDAVRTGTADNALTETVHAVGRTAFAKEAARAFARTRAALGDLASAAEIVRLVRPPSRGNGSQRAWCTEATLALARTVLGTQEIVQVRCEGEDRVLIRSAVVSGDDDAAVAGLAAMMREDDVAGALAHARIIGITAPGLVINAVLALTLANRARQYVELLGRVHHLVGGDRQARRSILDAAVAVGTGDLRVMPPSAPEVQARMRLIALFAAPRRATADGDARPRRHAAPRGDADQVKCVDIEGLAEHEAGVQVIKCGG